MRNRYTDILGFLALGFLALAVVIAVGTAAAGETVVVNPFFYLGGVLGIVWLVVKAVTAGQRESSRE